MASPQGATLTATTATLTGPGLSSATIHLHGATVTSYTSPDGTPRLYLSPTADLTGATPIRGGIPVCWPQFGPGPLWPKQHGFARRLPWAVDPASIAPGTPAVTLTLRDGPRTAQPGFFAAPFRLSLRVALTPAGALSVTLTISNPADAPAPLTFSTCLHAYLAADPAAVSVPGLGGVSYRDNTDALPEKVQAGDVAFGGEVDRCYVSAPDAVRVAGAGVVVTKAGLPELVVWNPWADKAAALPDMPDDGYQRFVCVEPALVYPPRSLAPGETHVAAMTIAAEQ